MAGIFNKVKEAASGYTDKDTGKTGYSGIAAEGQEAYKNYKTDAADGNVDWKKQGTDLFTNVKGGFGGAKGGAQPAEGAPAEPPPN